MTSTVRDRAEGLYPNIGPESKIFGDLERPPRQLELLEAAMTVVESGHVTLLDMAARTAAVTEVYGHGENAVRALDGKSTLMHCIAGLDALTSGRAFIGDIDLGSLSLDVLAAIATE